MAPFLIRKINKRIWDRPEFPSGKAVPVPADPVGDFSTENDEISVCVVEENNDNLDGVITALSGAKTTNVSHFDYAIFDSPLGRDFSWQLKPTPGQSPDKEANRKWHRDIVVETADNLCAIAKTIYSNCTKERVLAAQVNPLVRVNPMIPRGSFEKVVAQNYADLGFGRLEQTAVIRAGSQQLEEIRAYLRS